jgi:hypothetical protein
VRVPLIAYSTCLTRLGPSLLLNAQRTASLRHDTESLATLINLLLRSYLLTSSYTAASTLLSKVTYPDSSVATATSTSTTTASTASSNTNGTPSSLNQLLSGSTSSPAQLARYLYYVGRIRAIELSYTLAHNHLLQAVRRAPKAEQAPGFWQEVMGICNTLLTCMFIVSWPGAQMARRGRAPHGRYTRTRHLPSTGPEEGTRGLL